MTTRVSHVKEAIPTSNWRIIYIRHEWIRTTVVETTRADIGKVNDAHEVDRVDNTSHITVKHAVIIILVSKG